MAYETTNSNRTPAYEADVAALAPVIPQNLTDVQLALFIKSNKGLNDSLMPVLRPLAQTIGFRQDQLEKIVNVAALAVKPKGRNEKAYHFLEALGRAYSEDELVNIPLNRKAFKIFLRELEEVEELREDLMGSAEVSDSYNLAFSLYRKLGPDRANQLYNRLVEEGCKGTSVSKGIKAVYLIQEIIREAEARNCTPEAVLELRRREMDESFFEGFDDESED